VASNHKQTNSRKAIVYRVVLIIFCIIVCVSMVLAFIPSAFAEFAPSSTKTLGVGRLQTSTPSDYTADEGKLSFKGLTSSADASTVTQLATPITRAPQASATSGSAQSSDSKSLSTSTSSAADASAAPWETCQASAYGPSAGSTTANGSSISSSSMGVAVPAQWSYLLGSTIQISYNGMVVTAVVNDTGNFLGFGRGLDLQPGIWRAFGFSSEEAWGVRTVSWRVVG
jgi:hypothetical protein